MPALASLRHEIASVARRARFYGDLPMVLRILGFRPVRARFYKEFWNGAAHRIGADCTSLDGGWYRLDLNGRTTFVRHHQMMLDSDLTLKLMGDKTRTHAMLAELGVPVPANCTFSMGDPTPALTLLERFGTIVVKPCADTGGGRGVTTGIKSAADLKQASRHAIRFSKSLVAEQEVSGASYRLLYLNGRFIDAIRRDPPCVISDGTATIRQLVKRENNRRLKEPRPSALSPLVLDRDAKAFLKMTGQKISDVPEAGARVQVKAAVNENNAAQNHAVGHRVSQDIKERCGAIATALSVQLAGIDLYCHDITGPFSPQNCTIGEVNTTPGLHHHALVANPADARPVGEIILDTMFQNGIGTLNLSGAIDPTPGTGGHNRLGAKERFCA